MGHQHTFSSGTMSNSTPHFTPSNLHNGNANGSQVGANDNLSPHWQYQLQLYEHSKGHPAHYHARDSGATSTLPRTSDEAAKEVPADEGKVERNRAMVLGQVRRQDWDALDCSGQGLKALSRPLFSHFTFLKKLYLDHNRLLSLNPMIGQLRNLTHLDISDNQISHLPEEIGMLVNLKDLLMFDNNIRILVQEIGQLFKLEFLGVEGNPLQDPYVSILAQHGTRALITQLRETAEGKKSLETDIAPFVDIFVLTCGTSSSSASHRPRLDRARFLYCS